MKSILDENGWVFEWATCLADSPDKEGSCRFVEQCLLLGNGPSQKTLRTLASISLFKEMARIENDPGHPIQPFIDCLDRHSELLASGSKTLHVLPTECNDESDFKDVVEATGHHFGALFSDFDEDTYFVDGLKVVTDRLKKNDYPLDSLQGKKALDAGCGGGRYAVALRKLGLGHVTGVDMSSSGLADARQRVQSKGIDGVEFVQADVLDLPFEDETFDFIWSSGVLHHTTDMQKGVDEFMRVLKPGGCGYFYLIEKPSGIFWECIELLRILMKDVSFDFARVVYKVAGVSAYDTFYILDHVQVPINIRSTPEEVEQLLSNGGAKNIRRLTRGTGFDRVELIHQQVPYADLKYGVGENRYYFEK